VVAKRAFLSEMVGIHPPVRGEEVGMETRIDVTDRDAAQLDSIRDSLTTLEGVQGVDVDTEGSALVVEHDPDVITAGELTARVGSEGARVLDQDESEGDPATASRNGSEAAPQPEDEASSADGAEGSPRTTTTGDDAQDIRGPGDGAEQDVAAVEAERRGELLGHSEWER
jgi:hypothetical protein